MQKTKLSLTMSLIFLSISPAILTAQSAARKEREGQLIAIIQKADATRKEKADACRELSVIGTKDAVAPLAALLADEELSHMARYGLEPIPDPAVDEALLAALGSLKGLPQVGVIGSLGVRRVARAAEPLAQLLSDPDPFVVQAAARSLGKIASPTALKALQDNLPNAPAAHQLAFCEGLFRCADALMAQGKPDQAITIYNQLLNLPGAAHQVRGGALRGMILAQKDPLPLLKKSLAGDDYILFTAALQAAQLLPGPAVTAALTEPLPRLPLDNQILILQALGDRNDTSALPAVIEITKNQDTALRITALKTLGQLGHASVVPVLFEAALDSQPEAAAAAQAILAGLPEDPQIDTAILDRAKTGSANPTNARLIAIDLVAQRRIIAGNPLLFQIADDPDKSIRIAALDTLGKTGEPADLANLVTLLVQRKNPEELRAAENTVKAVAGKAPDKPACNAALLKALPQAQPEPACALLRLLRTTGGPDALQAVRTAAKNTNPQIQETAIRTLCEWPTADAAPDLLQMAKTAPSDTTKIAALRGYINLIRDPALAAENKMALAQQAAQLVQRDEEKKLLLGALAEIPAADALAMAVTALDNPATQNEAILAVLAISEKIAAQKPAETAAALQKVLDSTKNEDISNRAKEILSKIQQ